MKNKNILYIPITLILIAFSLHTPVAHGVMRATFPDSKSLQPAPADSFPNVSGNMNSTVGTAPTSEAYDPQTGIPESPSQEVPMATDAPSHALSYILWSLGIIAVLVFGFVIYFKSRKNS
jgi:hypothetical protein